MLKQPPGNDETRVGPGNHHRLGLPNAILPSTRPFPVAEGPGTAAARTGAARDALVAMRSQGPDERASASPGRPRREGETTGAIHILPHSPALSREAAAVLKRSIESGQDLGSRRHHIQALDASLAVAQAEVRRRAELLRRLGPELGVDLEELYQEFMRYADSVGRLSTTLLSNLPALPDDGEPPAGRG